MLFYLTTSSISEYLNDSNLRLPLFSLQSLTSFNLGLSVLLETDGLDGNKASGLGRLELSDLVHGALAGIVELACLRGSSKNVHHSLIAEATNCSADILLGSND